MLFQLVAVRWFAYNVHTRANVGVAVAEASLTLALLTLIGSPGNLNVLRLVALLQVCDSLVVWPIVPNHRLITSGINLLILMCSVRLQSPIAELRSVEFWNRFTPPARCCVIVVYVFATLHKLNRDFFNPGLSCATEFYRHTLEVLPFLPLRPFVFSILPVGTVLGEGLLAFTLLFSRFRSFGVVLGLLFHFCLAIDLFKHFFDFSSTMYALLICLFLPESVLSRIALEARRKSAFLGQVASVGIFLWVAILAASFSDVPRNVSFFYFARMPLWILWSVQWIVLVLASLRAPLSGVPVSSPQAGFFRPVSPISAGRTVARRATGLSYVLPFLFIVNGISPYLGLKNRSSFDMYSNLRVTHDKTNHFFLPSLDLLGLLDKPVLIVETSNAELRQMSQDSFFALPEIELWRHLCEHPETVVRYRQNGVEYRIDPTRGEVPLEKHCGGGYLLARRLLWFRPIDISEFNRCQW